MPIKTYDCHAIVEHILGFHDNDVTGDEFMAHGAVNNYALALRVIPQLRRQYALVSSANWNYTLIPDMYRYLSQSLGYDSVLPPVISVDGERKALSGYSHTYLNRNGLINNISIIFGNVLLGSHERQIDYGYIRQQCNALCSELAALLACTKPVHESILGTGDTGITGDEFVAKPPHPDEVIDHGNGVTQKFTNGIERWHKDGKLHRDDDKPAIIYPDGCKAWYKNGVYHRDGDKPAIYDPDGYQAWFKNGKRHRDGDKPAIIHADGTRYWYKDGEEYDPAKGAHSAN